MSSMTPMDPTTADPEIQIEIPTRRGPEPVTSAALHGVGFSENAAMVDEPTSSAIEPDESPVEKNGCQLFLDWYLYPYKNVLYCLKCVLYHVINWLFMLKMFIFACTYIPLDLGLIVLACSGLLLFYVCFEYQILMSWIDVALSFYLVEDDREMIEDGRPRLGYRILPECGDCPNRMKVVMLSPQTYKATIYFLLFKPIVVWITSCSIILLIVEGGLLSLWIIVAAHPAWFQWTDGNGNPRGITFGHAFGIFIGGIVLLPIVMHIVVWAAKLSKIVSYFFLTSVFNKRSSEETRLLVGQSRADSQAVTNGLEEV